MATLSVLSRQLLNVEQSEEGAALRGMAEVNLGWKKSTWIISNHVFFPLQVYFHNYLQAIPYFFLC